MRDEEAMNASLDNDYGTTAGPNSPDSWEVALFVGDPEIPEDDDGGVEADPDDCPGYARVAVAHADFPAAADGMKVIEVQFPAATGEWIDAPTHWGIVSVDPDGIIWDTGEFREEVVVASAGDGPLIECAFYYGDNVISAEDE